MDGRKVVVFVSIKQNKKKAKSAVNTLRSVREKLLQDSSTEEQNDVPTQKISFVRVDCSAKENQDKCNVAKFHNFPRWFVHTEQGGIEDLWNPNEQTSESIVEFFKFRISEKPIPNAQVNDLKHFQSVEDLSSVRPVVVNFEMPFWSLQLFSKK